jgi:hypothetical protein
MSASREQIEILRKVMRSLGSLREEVVLVGGMAAGFLVTDPGAAEPRNTLDVDLIVEVTSKFDYYDKLRKELLARGFREDTREKAPLCRWVLNGQPVDVMPTDPAVLGFSNPWYSHAIATATKVQLPTQRGPTLEFRLVTAPSFLATKMASFASRGAGSLLHHDIEDIVSLADGRAQLVHEIAADVVELREFVAQSMATLLRAGLEEHITSHLPGDAASQARAPSVLETLRRIESLTEPCR